MDMKWQIAFSCFFFVGGVFSHQGKAPNPASFKRFDQTHVKAAFTDLGAKDELELDIAKEVVSKHTGQYAGRLVLKHDGLRVWGGKSVVFTGFPDTDGMHVIRGPHKNLDKKAAGAVGRGTNPNASIQKCMEHFQHAPSTKGRTSYELVWHDREDTDNSSMTLCHVVTIDGKEQHDDNPYSVSCLVDLKNNEVLHAWHEYQPGLTGGNPKLSAIFYTGAKALPASPVASQTSLCEMISAVDNFLYVYNNNNSMNTNWKAMTPMRYNCFTGPSDAINGGNCPSCDSFYNGAIALKMLFDPNWGNLYDKMQLNSIGRMNFLAHFSTRFDNACWSNTDMAIFIGDGGDAFYPLGSCLDIVAHEMGHALTSVRSALAYAGESGCMNEAFSDMYAEAAENYYYGKNDWKIAKYCLKYGDDGIRDMTIPATYSQYLSGEIADCHDCSAIYNYGFYKLSTLNTRWSIRRAFYAFLSANSFLWTQNTRMAYGWCQVILAGYLVSELDDVGAVQDACDIQQVGKMIGFDCTDQADVTDILSYCNLL